MRSHILFFLCILEDAAQRFGNLETRTGQVEDQVHSLEGSFNVSMKSFLVSFTKRSQQIRGLNKLKTMRTVLKLIWRRSNKPYSF